MAHYGPNRLPPPARRPVWVRFLLQFHNVLIYMMLVAAGIAALLSHWIDAAVLFAAVVVNAVIGFIQEGKAEATMIIGALGLFHWELDRGASLETARTMAVSAVVMAEMFYLLNSRYIYRSVLSREGLFGNRYVPIVIAACAALQLAYVHTGPLQKVFGSTDLTALEWLKLCLAGALVFTVAEAEKSVIRLFGLKACRSTAGQVAGSGTTTMREQL